MRLYHYLLILLLVQGCASSPTPKIGEGLDGTDPKMLTLPEQLPYQDLSTGVTLHRNGHYIEAIEQLRIDIDESESEQDKTTLKLYLTDALLRQSQYRDAASVKSTINPEQIEPYHRFLLQLLNTSRLYSNDPKSLILALNNPVATISQLYDHLDLYATYHQIRAEAYIKLENYYQAAKEYFDRSRFMSSDSEIVINQNKIWLSLSHYTTSQLLEVQEKGLYKPLDPWVDLLLSTRNSITDGEKFLLTLYQWQQRYPDHSVHLDILNNIVTQSDNLILHPKRIAVLLPLTGKFSKAAFAVRDGILAAYYEDPNREKVSLRFYDTYANTDIGSYVYKEALNDGADFILGPLDKDVINGIQSSELPQIPTLTLNIGNNQNDNAYMFSLLPEDEAVAIAEKAWNDGFQRAALLLPNSSLGHRLSESFSKRWSALGGEVVSESFFNAKKNDFATPIKELLDIDESELRLSRLQSVIGNKVEFTPRRRNDIEFIFMSAFPLQARLIKPQLRFHHATDVPVYATSHLYSGETDVNKDRDMNEIIFGDMPWLLKPDETRIKSSNQLRDIYQGQLQRLVAMGIDGYNIIQRLPYMAKTTSETYEGQSGLLSMTDNHRIARHLTWAEFIRGVPHLVREEINIEPLEQTIAN